MPNTTELSEAKRALLERFLRGNAAQNGASTGAIPQRAPGSAAPLSFGQQQMWLLAQLIPETPAYNECVTLLMPGPLDCTVLERSFNELLRRHEAWRTSFPAVDGEPVQMIHPSLTLSLPVLDLRHLPEAEREGEAIRLAREDALHPFDLARVPLLRAKLIRIGDEDHRLFLTLHHIIFDGLSVYQVFLSELRELYEAFLAGQPSPLPELPIQYADFAAWQREEQHGEAFASQLAYWKKQLAAAPAVLELPTDHSRPSIPTYRGSKHMFELSKSLSDALRTLSNREGATPFITLSAAFNVLLYRYMGQEDLLIGTATAGRNRPEIQKLLGDFINMLVMRTDLSGDPTFRELLQRVREVTVEAMAHQDVPFEYLVKELRPEREPGQNPLFQVLFMLEPAVPALPSGWTITHRDVNTGTSKFDLSLVLEDRPEGYLGYFDYSTDLFDAETIERMAGHWQTLLEGIVNDPAQRIAELPLLTELERQQLLIEWNSTQTAYAGDRCIHLLFEEQVERTPSAEAVFFEGERLTYQELDQRANQLAHHLQKLGVGPDVLVGLCLERSVEMLVGLLGILKAGGAYVPLDPKLPQERLAFMLEEIQAPVLVTQRRLATILPDHTAQPVYLDEWEVLAQESEVTPDSGVQAANLAYVIYTSGSTGKPKGVMIEHGSVVNLATALAESVYAGQQGPLRVSLNAPLAFDASVKQIVQLLSGHTLYILPEEVRLDGEALLAYLDQHSVDVLDITPVQLKFLLSAGLAQRTDRVPALVLVGGEMLDKAAWQMLATSPKTRYYNVYGPTESTVDATACQIQPALSEPVIGRPLANIQVYLLDKQGQPVPIGVPGEIHIGGVGLARGYLNRPELTAEKFIAHPWSSQPGARLYKTGDLARYRPNGNIEILGRLDHQIKLRGFRLELGEIEAVLRQHAAVHEALVLARESEQSEKHLVAYIVPRQEQKITFSELRGFLKEYLPEYMVPSDFVSLEAFPLTANGKIDRQALAALETTGLTMEDSFVAPRLLVHHQLVQIWEELLDVRPIGIADNFFSLGGHSLLAVRLMARIEQVCGKKLPLTILYAGATIEYLACALQEENESSAERSLDPRARVVTVQPGGSKRPFFFLHGDWYGGGFYCLNLARGLEADQPFYVLEPYDFDRHATPPTFEEMAAAHIEALRGVQPEGPYLLGGFCNGGLMAYEMARQLHAQGQTVDMLILIDPAMPHSHGSLRRLINRFGSLTRLNQNIQVNWFLRYLYQRIPSYRKKVQESVVEQRELRHRWGKALPKLDLLYPTVAALRYQWSGIYRWVSSAYMPGLYEGKITFFWSSEAFTTNGDWRQLSGSPEVEDHIFPGSHMSCKNENLHVVAESLGQLLSQAQETMLIPQP